MILLTSFLYLPAVPEKFYAYYIRTLVAVSTGLPSGSGTSLVTCSWYSNTRTRPNYTQMAHNVRSNFPLNRQIPHGTLKF